MTQTYSAADVQDLRERIIQLQLKEKKLEFMLANMHRMCVHYDQRIEMLQGHKPNVTLFIGNIHFLEKDPRWGTVIVDGETFEAELVRLMKEAGQ